MEKHIILLHGALGSKSQFDEMAKHLIGSYQMHAFNFIGHGGMGIPDRLTMEDFVGQLQNYIQNSIPENTSLTLFGYSMGGYAALLLAARNTSKIDRIITLGTKLLWNEEIAAKELKMLDANVIEEKLPDFAKELQMRHHPSDWKLLLNRTGEMMMDLGANKYLNDETFSQITIPCKLMIGDKDKMVSFKETEQSVNKLKQGKIVLLDETPHPIEKVDMGKLIFEIEGAY